MNVEAINQYHTRKAELENMLDVLQYMKKHMRTRLCDDAMCRIGTILTNYDGTIQNQIHWLESEYAAMT
jgi:hypothetical protein